MDFARLARKGNAKEGYTRYFGVLVFWGLLVFFGFAGGFSFDHFMLGYQF
jgi:hypothetical protein